MPLAEIAGHRRLVELLARSVARGTLPPTLLFAGPSGVGKRRTAVAVAQLLNCLNPVQGPADGGLGFEAGGRGPEAGGSGLAVDACGRCAACTRIARNVHPDVLVVEPGDSGAIKIDQVRDVIDRTAYRPFEGKRRVVIVDEADALVAAAQNALLKTLEEPPPSSVFILVTSRPDVLLPTVRSRAIRLTFAEGGRLEVDDEAREVADRVLAQLARFDAEREGIGRAAASDARRLDAAKELLANTGGGGAGDREQLGAHLQAMASLLRDVEALSAGAGEAALANADVKGALERLATAYRGARGVEAFAAIDRALAALDANAGVKVVADWLVLQV